MSRSNRSTLAWLALVAAAGLLLGWWAARPRTKSGVVLSDATKRTADQAARTLSTLDGMVSLSDPGAVAASFEAADVRGPSTVNERDIEAVRLAATEFINLRLAEGAKPDAYVASRVRAGYRLNSDAVLEGVWEVGAMFRARRGTAAPADKLELFKIIASNDLEFEGGPQRPVKLASDGRGVLMVFGVMDRSNPLYTALEGYFPSEVWGGMVSAAHLPVFAPPTDLDAMLKRDGQVRFCRVGVIVENRAGERYPIVLSMIYDPQKTSWFLESVSTCNTTTKVPLILH